MQRKFNTNTKNKLGLSWAKLKLSLVRVVDKVTVIFNSVEVEIEVTTFGDNAASQQPKTQ